MPELFYMNINLAKVGCLCGVLAAGYYLHLNPLPLTHPIYRSLFNLVDEHKPEWSLPILRGIVKAGLFDHSEQLRGRVLASGFDTSGNYLHQLKSMGFKGVKIGQVSYNPSRKDDPYVQLGIRHVLANIHGFRQLSPSEFVVEIEIAPDIQVIQYTPYLVEQNLLQTVRSYCEIQKMTQQTLANRLEVTIDRRQYEIEASPQQLANLKASVQRQIRKEVNQHNKNEDKRAVNIHFQATKESKYITWEQIIAHIRGTTALL